ncbi:MAG: glycosyltransferase family 1 protein [Anaerolineales bacterium]|nr:glycosyltransferase family 1 protein [Anaerolineales bacterium]
MEKINLGFVITSDGDQWTGGMEYYLNLFKAIRKADTTKRVKIVGLVVPGLNPVQIQRLAAHLDETRHIPKPSLVQKAYEYIKDKRRSLFPPFVISFFDRKKLSFDLDIIFAPPYMVEYTQKPAITWIPDFQHAHMPDSFSASEVASRNYIFQSAARKAHAVILSSESAYADFKKLFPESADKVRVLRFASHISETIFTTNPSDVIKKYALPDKFYYLPNQFWKHKNHQVVLDALEICLKEIPEMRVVCTGNLYENRDPTYPSRLLAEISSKRLRDHFIVLGLIDRSDVYALMRYCLSVIQPSLFEGWSTTVEEAKLLGKPILLSNIAVHLEQAPPHARYFDPLDARQLADLMTAQWNLLTPGVNSEIEQNALIEAEKRMSEYGHKFIEVLQNALAKT